MTGWLAVPLLVLGTTTLASSAPFAEERALQDDVRTTPKTIEESGRETYWVPVLEGGYGAPTGAFASAGLRLIQTRRGDDLIGGNGGQLSADLGTQSGRMKLGYVFHPLPASGLAPPVGLSVNAFVAQGWKPADKLKLGGELELSILGSPFDVVHGRVGVMAPLHGPHRDVAVTWGVSVNVIAVLMGVLAHTLPCYGCH